MNDMPEIYQGKLYVAVYQMKNGRYYLITRDSRQEMMEAVDLRRGQVLGDTLITSFSRVNDDFVGLVERF